MKVLIVGCGNMGTSHAWAYRCIEGCEVVGLVNRSLNPRLELSVRLGQVPHFSDYEEALDQTHPDIVAICTHVSYHAPYAKLALQKGAHVFVEKPIATSVEEGQEVIELAQQKNKKVLVGYILRHHPSWQKFIQKAKLLGSPLVMRLNLNQQSHGATWETHKKILESQSPLVDCGVHYIDVMCQMTDSNPIKVSAIGARLTEEIAKDQYNYGQLQVTFENGSVGWYEAGWGPMMSEQAYFVKDVLGPKGAVSMLPDLNSSSSDSLESHTQAQKLLLHNLDQKDQVLKLDNEPDHQELCKLQQLFLLKAIQNDWDLSDHYHAALNSLKVVLAADQAIAQEQTIEIA